MVFLSCDTTVNHVKKCYLSASVKADRILKYSLLLITASISLGENIFPSLRSLIATFRIDIYVMLFRLPAVERLFRPKFVENENLLTMDIVNNKRPLEFLLIPPQYKSQRNVYLRVDQLLHTVSSSAN